ncbi:MAG: nucleotide sugar dehydrogenase [Candidatus Moranbacteria bacterium]|nr:nucleotide sugar dehydrogenase [bacterium]MDP1833440.1 nucleotide sugar dehydrogenase [Candidatus Moranbacteria bacterium]
MEQKKAKVCVIGLGYVGLPLAVRCVEKGYETFGLDMDKNKVDLINQGKSPIEEKFLADNLPTHRPKATTDEKIIEQSDVILICVPTPVDDLYMPDLSPVISATKAVVRNLKKGALVVLESTVNPGVSEEIVKPLFEEAGFKVGKDVFIAHCPERINPGDPKWNVTNIPRVVGSFDKQGLATAVKFYESIVDGAIRPMKSIREAEAVKIVENSFRDINIAFVNELAKSFDKLGIDVKDVVLGASTKPFAFMPHFPSCGVGGHCIPVDPYYLIERAKKSGFDHKFLKIAREINNSMPSYTVEILQDALNELRLPMKGTKIGVLGISYKANVDDTRESPTFKILTLLGEHGVKYDTYDPHILKRSTIKTLPALLKKVDALIIATDHKEFKEIDPRIFKQNGIKVIIDGKNCLDKDAIKKLGIIYKGIGR